MRKVGILDFLLTELFAPSCCVFRSRVPKKQSRWYPLLLLVLVLAVVAAAAVVVVVCVQIQNANKAVKTIPSCCCCCVCSEPECQQSLIHGGGGCCVCSDPECQRSGQDSAGSHDQPTDLHTSAAPEG